MAALVTGVGYIGSELVALLLDRGERVVGLENFYCTARAAVTGTGLAGRAGFSLVEGDVAAPADVARALDLLAGEPGPLAVYHLAAQPSAAAAARDPAYTERANLTGARVLLEALAEREGPARVVFGGSFRVYGDDLAGEVGEEAPYGRVGDLSHLSKVYVEGLGRMLSPRLPFASVRLGVVYGWARVMKSDPAFMTVPNLFCHRAARGEPLRVLEDRPVAFIHITDAARALVAAVGLLADEGGWHVLNAAPDVRSIGEVATLVQGLAGERGLLAEVAPSPGSVPPSFTVRSRLETAGAFRAERHMDEALGAVLDHFIAAVAA